MKTMISNLKLWLGAGAVLMAVLLFPGLAQADTSVDLCATTGSTTLPDGAVLPIYGYVAGNCAGATDTASLPGPLIRVTAGETVTVILYNDLAEQTALVFNGVAMPPDLVGAAPGASQGYTFVAGEPGTYLYEAGLLPNAQHQVAMGLYGALIVDPATPGQTYDAASTAYDDEAVLVLSELDPAVSSSSDMRNYAPRYFLINGKAYPQTDPIPTAAGRRVLLRYLNAGIQLHSMALLGLNETVIAYDGSPLALAHDIVAETMGPGQTMDTITTIPATATDGALYALHDGNLMLHNSNAAGFGGMLTFLTVGTAPPPGADTAGPNTGAVTLAPNPTNETVAVAISAGISDAATGDSNIQAAEFYVDSTAGTAIAMTAADGVFDSPSETAQGSLTTADLAALASGTHTIYVRGQDVLGNWGPVNFATLNLDKSGPATAQLTLTPNPANGTLNVALHATASDSGTGNGNIVAAEYFIDTAGGTGAGTPMTVNLNASSASLDAVIAAATVGALTDGPHTVLVRAQDALLNWGALATIDLVVDTAGPQTGNVATAPSPNNGTLGIDSNTQAVRVTATFTDPQSAGVVVASVPAAAIDATDFVFIPYAADGVAATAGDVRVSAAANGVPFVSGGEFFIDGPGATGSGIPMVPTDGLFNSAVEKAFGDIPLSTVAQFSEGAHAINVHGQDAAGNWGAFTSAQLVIDKTPPTVSGASASPNPTDGAPSVTLSVAVADTATAITRVEWFTGADPGQGNGAVMTLVAGTASATIDMSGWAEGTYPLNVRARDAAGNWSSTANTPLAVTHPIHFSTSGNANPPGVGGSADDADLYAWDGAAFSRAIDVTALGLPGNASVDGLVRSDDTHFYLSFSGNNTSVPGLGSVQDEDVVYYNAGVWSVFFDGTGAGLTNNNQDLDAIDSTGGLLYFSTAGNANPPGVAGAADDADIYTWNGSTFSRVLAATAIGIPAGANVDGLKWVDATHVFLSFNDNVTLPGIGGVQDEDIVYYNNGVWVVYFDGTGKGLTSNNHNVDAFDLP